MSKHATANPASSLASRIVSIDALRGLTVAFMILVNDPGDWSHLYSPLEHAEWNGWTPTDLVFPSFLFLVGCSIVFAVRSRVASGVPRARIAGSMLRRALLIFLIKMLLSAYPHFHLTHLRLYGVLTRIALCYLAAGLLFLFVRSWRALAAITVLLLVGYWVLLRFIPVPGLGLPVRDFPLLDPERNLAAWMDRGVNAWTRAWLHTGSLYNHTHDPEGLLSTLPAIATTLLGVLAGLWLRRPEPATQTAAVFAAKTRNGLAGAGGVLLCLGLVWSRWFPINKNLWTSSYVLLAGGWSLLALAVAYALLDHEDAPRPRWLRAVVWPMLVFGANAITAFAVSNLLVETLLWIHVGPEPGEAGSLWAWLYTHLFAFHGSTPNTSLAFALAYVVACFVPNWLLWRRRIFLRV